MSESLCVVGSWPGEWRTGDYRMPSCGCCWLRCGSFVSAGSAEEHPGRFTQPWPPVSTCFGSAFTSLLSSTVCDHCYVVTVGALVGVFLSDIMLTILIAVAVFFLTMQHKRRRERDSEPYRPLPDGICSFSYTRWKVFVFISTGKRNQTSVVKKPGTEVTESPYQVKPSSFGPPGWVLYKFHFSLWINCFYFVGITGSPARRVQRTGNVWEMKQMKQNSVCKYLLVSCFVTA